MDEIFLWTVIVLGALIVVGKVVAYIGLIVSGGSDD